MNSKNLIVIRRKSPYKMDPTSDRYRECPNDGVKFMAAHRSEKFCCDKCADEFHNLKKKEEAENLIDNGIKLLETPPLIMDQNIAVQHLNIIDQNLRLLEKWDIDLINGTQYHMEWMCSQGYDLTAYAYKGALYNIDPTLNCNFTQIGNYRLYRVSYTHILITKTK